MRWPGAAPGDHRLDVLILSFQHCFNPSVAEVLHPSGEVSLFRFIAGAGAEEDTLYPSADKEVDPGF
jgi:hypothetical protein